MAANPHLHLVAPTTVKQTVAPDMDRRRANAELRSREYLTANEVERLIAAAKDGRHGHRDATMLLVAYRHGLPSRT
jgi:type 1 fimbriae regulatory protein FimB/type 1 fimbriae regulatory protein FimE